MPSSTTFNNKISSIKKSPNKESRASLLGGFSIEEELQLTGYSTDWDTRSRYTNLRPTPTLREILEQLKIYPEAKEYLQDQLKENKQKIQYLEEYSKHIDDYIYRKVNKESEWFWRDIIEELEINIPKQRSNIIIKRNTFILENKSKDFKYSIEKAKQYPIDQLLEFNYQGKAKCLWHNEKTASLHYYGKTNTVKCFGCGEFADSIKVYQKLKGCTFNQSLKALQ